MQIGPAPKDTLLDRVIEACGQFQPVRMDLYSKDDVGKKLENCTPIQTYTNIYGIWFTNWTDFDIFMDARLSPNKLVQPKTKQRTACSTVRVHEAGLGFGVYGGQKI